MNNDEKEDTLNIFAKQLPASARLLGLDVGKTTIGLAISDNLRMIASALRTISRSKLLKDIEEINSEIAKYEVRGIVVGYPLNMNGSHGPRTQATRSFVVELKKHISLPILLWDERMTTMVVERVMLDADMSRKRRDELVDKLAASYILQGALDRLRRIESAN